MTSGHGPASVPESQNFGATTSDPESLSPAGTSPTPITTTTTTTTTTVTETTPLLHRSQVLKTSREERQEHHHYHRRQYQPQRNEDDDDDEEEEEEDEETTVLAAPPSTARLALTLGATYVGVFLGAVDSSIMATLTAPIASEFRSLSLLSWLAAAYLVANATSQPLSGRLTDVFGRGPGLVFCNAAFALGTLVCGLAADGPAMMLGRAVAGLGGGGLMSISTFLASDLVPLKKRGVVQGIGNIAYG